MADEEDDPLAGVNMTLKIVGREKKESEKVQQDEGIVSKETFTIVLEDAYGHTAARLTRAKEWPWRPGAVLTFRLYESQTKLEV